MKKDYQKPTVEVITIASDDYILTSFNKEATADGNWIFQ